MPSDVVEEPPSEWSVFGETGLTEHRNEHQAHPRR